MLPARGETSLAQWWLLGIGLILGSVFAILVSPVAIAGAVILVIIWVIMATRSRIDRSLTVFASGYLLAILIYGVLVILGILTGDPPSGQSLG